MKTSAFIEEIENHKFKLYQLFIMDLKTLIRSQYWQNKFIEEFDLILTEKSLDQHNSDELHIKIIEFIKNSNMFRKDMFSKKDFKKLIARLDLELKLNMNYLSDLWNHIKVSQVLISLLSKYRDKDMLLTLRKIQLFYRDNKDVLDALDHFKPFLQSAFRKCIPLALYVKNPNLKMIEEDIEKFEKYINMSVSEDFDLVELFEKRLDGLSRRKGSNRKYQLQKIEKYKKEHKDWLDNYPEKLLDMYNSLRKGGKNFIREERDSLMEVLRHLKAKLKDMGETTKRAKLVYSKRIIDFISQYEILYPNLIHLKHWAEEEYKKYEYLKHI